MAFSASLPSSRTPDPMQAPALRWGIARTDAGTEALARDTEVDVIYVAAPRHRHHLDAIAAIASCEHVPLEQALAPNAGESR